MNNENKNCIKKLTPFKGWVLENFPFIEDDFDAITNYQLLCIIVEYLNKVIASENEQNEAIKEIQDYLKDLDLQDEVDNKLDEMAESGQLSDIIAQYLGLAGMITFNNVAEMKQAQNLVNGSKCATLGFYNVNDDGNALYKIRTITNDDIVDEKFIIALYDNTLIAELITDNLNIKKIGAKGNDQDDETSFFNSYINYCNLHNKNLVIPIGKYRIYNDLNNLNSNISIIGEVGNKSANPDPNYKTLIYDYRNSNNYLINYNNTGLGNSIENVSFSNKTENELKCINFNHGGYRSMLKNLSFNGYKQALYIESTHGTILENVNCVSCGGFNDNANIYAIEITNATDVIMDKCMIEHSRFMLYTHNNANAFILSNSYFEIASASGYKGNQPIIINGGKIINNHFVSRPVDTIATQINDTIENVYYMLYVLAQTSIINNTFDIGGANDGTTDLNNKQGKYLESNNVGVIRIEENYFNNCSFKVPSIYPRGRGSIFSNNIIKILIENPTTSELKSLYVINNGDRFTQSENNLYQIYSTNTAQDQLTYIPKLARYNYIDYKIESKYNSGSSFDNYSYKFERDYANIPTLVIQDTDGNFEITARQTRSNGLVYKALIAFDINSNYCAVINDVYTKLSTQTINFIKDTDKLIIQILNKPTNAEFDFKIENPTRSLFAYNKNMANQLTENVLLSLHTN